MTKNLRLSVWLVLFLPLSPGPSSSWEVLSSQHIEVLFHEEDSVLAERVMDAAQTSYPRVTGVIGFVPSVTVHIFLPLSKSEFNDLTGGAIPDWGVGCAYPARASIVLRPPIKGGRRLEEILAHELSHVVLGQAVGEEKTPRWFNEGVAMWQSGEWRIGQSMGMAWAVLTNSVIPLREIDSVLSFPSPKAQRAYVESFLAFVYLLNLGGDDVLPRIVQRVTSGASFEVGLRESTGYSPADFEAAWSRYVKKRFSPLSLLDSFSLWMAICALFFIAYILKRVRTRKTLKEWESEEDELDEIY